MTNRWLRTSSLAIALAALPGACASDSKPRNLADASLPNGEQLNTNGAEAGQSASLDTSSSSDATRLEGVLIDDFEEGKARTVYPGGAWYSYDDKSNGGGASITAKVPMEGPGFESSRSLEVSYTFDQGKLPYQSYVGWGVWFADKAAPMDISKYLGIGYTYRGDAHRVRIETFEVTDYDYFGMEMPASVGWKTVVVSFRQLSQEGWGIKVAFNPKNLGNISFAAHGATGTQGKVNMDNLMFLTRVPEQVPDMTVKPPAPPADEPIASIDITHPAQARARTYLTRGYNITNWLEEKSFDGFTYDAAFVSKLAAAGFKSLRLPVDLDRYIVGAGAVDGGSSVDADGVADGGEAVDAGGNDDVVLHEDLFTVLDAFVAWTASVGMSLTIDFHQYEKSLNKARPDTIARAVAVWGKVAARYASNPRKDLFYELLNETEQSMAGTPPTQAEWTAIAERMIAAIRASDTTHTILFGDVGWYGIGPLSVRKPLSDGNVVYVFHFYEPYIFTHQGADWVSMASTHDIPYPYSAERWSPYFGDLGFSPVMPSWILSAARNYYKFGNRSSIRNQIVQAKRWAVANNVPVICNEFGVYDRTGRMEDRARYLTDVISVFDELEIPWQQWFMIMDAAGNVAPEYKAALRLGQ